MKEANHVSRNRAGTCVRQCDKRALGDVKKSAATAEFGSCNRTKKMGPPAEEEANSKEPWGTKFPGNGDEGFSVGTAPRSMVQRRSQEMAAQVTGCGCHSRDINTGIRTAKMLAVRKVHTSQYMRKDDGRTARTRKQGGQDSDGQDSVSAPWGWHTAANPFDWIHFIQG